MTSTLTRSPQRPRVRSRTREVVLDPLRCHRLREHRCHRAGCASAAPPVAGDLRCGRLGDPGDHRVAEHLALRDRVTRRVGLGDAVLPAVAADLVVGEVRVDLDLVDRGHRVGLVAPPLADGRPGSWTPRCCGRGRLRPNSSERLPRRDAVAVVERRQWPVDEEQVDVVGARAVEPGRSSARAARVGVVEAVVELAGDVTSARSTSTPDARTDALARSGTSQRFDLAVADAHAVFTAAAVVARAIW